MLYRCISFNIKMAFFWLFCSLCFVLFQHTKGLLRKISATTTGKQQRKEKENTYRSYISLVRTTEKPENKDHDYIERNTPVQHCNRLF
jgi:hypothetical protein